MKSYTALLDIMASFFPKLLPVGTKENTVSLSYLIIIRSVAIIKKRRGCKNGSNKLKYACAEELFRKISLKSMIFEKQKSFKQNFSHTTNFLTTGALFYSSKETPYVFHCLMNMLQLKHSSNHNQLLGYYWNHLINNLVKSEHSNYNKKLHMCSIA